MKLNHIVIVLVIGMMLLAGCKAVKPEDILKVREKALETENPDLCAKIGSGTYKDGCYRDVGAKMEDVTVCDNIRGSSEKWDCIQKIARSTNTHTYCDLIDYQRDRDSCNLWVAYNLKDETICAKLPTETTGHISEFNPTQDFCKQKISDSQ